MADGIVQVAPDSTGAKIDNESLTVGANTVMRQRTQVAGASALEIARVINTAPDESDYGLVTRVAGLPRGARSFTGTATFANSPANTGASNLITIDLVDAVGRLELTEFTGMLVAIHPETAGHDIAGIEWTVYDSLATLGAASIPQGVQHGYVGTGVFARFPTPYYASVLCAPGEQRAFYIPLNTLTAIARLELRFVFRVPTISSANIPYQVTLLTGKQRLPGGTISSKTGLAVVGEGFDGGFDLTFKASLDYFDVPIYGDSEAACAILTFQAQDASSSGSIYFQSWDETPAVDHFVYPAFTYPEVVPGPESGWNAVTRAVSAAKAIYYVPLEPASRGLRLKSQSIVGNGIKLNLRLATKMPTRNTLLETGRTHNIGTTAIRISGNPAITRFVNRSVLMRASPNNKATLFVGNSDLLTDGQQADTTEYLAGFPLEPGDTLSLVNPDLMRLWVRSRVDTPKSSLFWIITG